jgi:hypothetical protein
MFVVMWSFPPPPPFSIADPTVNPYHQLQSDRLIFHSEPRALLSQNKLISPPGTQMLRRDVPVTGP